MATKKKKGKRKGVNGCESTTYASVAIAARVAGGHKARKKRVSMKGRTVTVCG